MSFEPQECAVILGSKSRVGKNAANAIGKKYGDQLGLMVLSRSPEELVSAIQKAKKKGLKAIIVGGGDGTLRLAAPHCISSELPMGIIPTGTGNALARELGIPLDPLTALELCFGDHAIKNQDVGYLNETLFVTTASCGLTANITVALSKQPKGVMGRAAYIPAVWNAVKQARPFRISVATINGSLETRASLFVAAASRTHAGPFPTTEAAANDDGLLSIYVVEGEDRPGLLRYGLGLLMKKHTDQPNVWSVDAPFADIHVTPRRFVLDGDPVRTRDEHVRFSVGHQVWDLIVPIPDPKAS